MQINVCRDLVLLRRIDPEDAVSAAGILLPPGDEAPRAVVVAVGPGAPAKLSTAGRGVVDALDALVTAYQSHEGRKGQPPEGVWADAIDALAAHQGCGERTHMSVQAGDTVIYSPAGVQQFKIGGEMLLACGENSILAVVEP